MNNKTKPSVDVGDLRNILIINSDALTKHDAIEAAADELERLRAELEETKRELENCIPYRANWHKMEKALRAKLDEANKLIDEAPHGRNCKIRRLVKRYRDDPKFAHLCNCWKSKR